MGPVLIMGANVCMEGSWGDVMRFGPRSKENMGAAGVGLGRGGEGRVPVISRYLMSVCLPWSRVWV